MKIGNQTQAGRMFDGLVRGAVFAQADGVVSEHMHHALFHQGSHAQGVARVVGKSQERDRKSVGWGKSVSVRVDLGGRRIIKKTTQYKLYVNDLEHESCT